jgi:hypothetical protein
VKSGRKFRRKTLKQWAAFARRGRRQRAYEHEVHLHRFEDEVILRKMRESGLESAKGLAGRYPELFDQRNLGRAMKRMARQGLLNRRRMDRFTGQRYSIERRAA